MKHTCLCATVRSVAAFHPLFLASFSSFRCVMCGCVCVCVCLRTWGSILVVVYIYHRPIRFPSAWGAWRGLVFLFLFTPFVRSIDRSPTLACEAHSLQCRAHAFAYAGQCRAPASDDTLFQLLNSYRSALLDSLCFCDNFASIYHHSGCVDWGFVRFLNYCFVCEYVWHYVS